VLIVIVEVDPIIMFLSNFPFFMLNDINKKNFTTLVGESSIWRRCKAKTIDFTGMYFI
jgi:hypothetical protein